MKCKLMIVILIVLTGCGGGHSENTNESSPPDIVIDTPVLDPDAQPITIGNWYRPPLHVQWQIQLNGELNLTYSTEIYDIDLFDTSEQTISQIQSAGKKVICYFSAGTFEDWRPDASLFKPADLGKKLDEWPGEQWLDIRSTTVHDIMKARLDLARKKGCDGVDPDNMDGYTQDSGLILTAEDQIAYNRFIANEAHRRNLSVGLKNSLDQIAELVDYYDFSINEQCHQYNECQLLSRFIEAGKPVLNVEYLSYDNTGNVHQALCAKSVDMQFSSLILPLGLDDGFRIACSS